MVLRIGSASRISLALAVATAIAWASPAFAQTGVEYGHTIAGVGMGGAGAPAIGVNTLRGASSSGGGPSKTVVIPGGSNAAPVSIIHSRNVKEVPEDNSPVDFWQGHVKVVKSSYAYERPTISATRIEPVMAGSYVDVIGASRYYAQVKLSNSEIAYVPLAAIALVKSHPQGAQAQR